jgi:outer membrane lipoprotein-sorting protein
MKIQKLLLPFFLIQSLNLLSQNDKTATVILDKFSSGATSAPSVSMKFKMTTLDQAANTRDTVSGNIILSKDKYMLDLTDNLIWFNGETTWSYLPVEKEVTISKPDRKDNSFQNRPSAIFSMYKKGYKCRLVEERTGTYVIDLYPEDLKSDMVRVRLIIGKEKLDLKTLEYKKKDGMVMTLTVLVYDLSIKPGADTFVFHTEKYKGVDVVDIR